MQSPFPRPRRNQVAPAQAAPSQFELGVRKRTPTVYVIFGPQSTGTRKNPVVAYFSTTSSFR
jgi:hypothetical protein